MHPMLNIAIRATRAGGRVLTQNLTRTDSLRTTEKGRNDFVTEVDRKSEAAIIAVLQKAYPDHAILGEESGDSGSIDAEFKWFIDPLDGTTNYLHGYPSFSVSVAVAQHNKVQQAVVYNPFSDELFTASRGNGAQLDGRRIRVSNRTSLEGALLATGFANNDLTDPNRYLRSYRDFMHRAGAIRAQGSAALELAFVAAGRLDGYWEYNLKPWDVAAGALLVREAGGLVGDMQAQDSWLETGNIVAAGPRVYDAMQRRFTTLGLHSIGPRETA